MTEPTDLELMMYADGELDPERAAEVARYLEANPTAGAPSKLFGLSVLSAHVRQEADRVATAHRADAIVAGVFDAIRAEQDASAKTNGASHSNGKTGAKVISIHDHRDHGRPDEADPHHDEPASTNLEPRLAKAANGPQKPANDNARLIFGLAGLAAAAAIALGMWGRGAPPLRGPADADSKVAAAEAASEPEADVAARNDAARNAAPLQIESNKKAPPPVQDGTPAVAVASVDFGTKTGAVYYVPSDSAGPTTTVVWVSE